MPQVALGSCAFIIMRLNPSLILWIWVSVRLSSCGHAFLQPRHSTSCRENILFGSDRRSTARRNTDPRTTEFQTEQLASLHTHAFWGKQRSSESIESHILACLDEIDDDSTNASVDVIADEPPLVVIHDFLSKSDCESIIQSSKDTQKLQRSTVGATQETGSSRTSSTVWLKDSDCQDPLRLIASKVSSISGLPTSHMENLQVVRYTEGEEFKLHTDHQDSFNDIDCRGRLATCLVYLSPCSSGGETWFPGVCEQDDSISIAPTQGSAVFFWNTVEKPGVDNYNPYMYLSADMRMRHAGLPVTEGEKWICNRWIHPIDFGAGVRGV